MNPSQRESVKLVDAFMQAAMARQNEDTSFEARVWQGSTPGEMVSVAVLRRQSDSLHTKDLNDAQYAHHRLQEAELFAGIFNRICTPEEKKALVPTGANKADIIAVLKQAKAVQLVKLFTA